MGIKSFLSGAINMESEFRRMMARAEEEHNARVGQLKYLISPEFERNKADSYIRGIQESLEKELSKLRIEEQRIAALFSERVAEAQRLARQKEMEAVASVLK